MKRISVYILLFLLSFLCEPVAVLAHRIVHDQSNPGIKIALPDTGYADKTVVIIPGGGYNHLAGAKEGDQWIPYFTARGIAVAVVRYQLPNGNREIPLGDVKRTFQMLRDNAVKWNLNPNGIGIMGFSAGGHLAAAYTGSSDIDVKPRFQILFYPVIRLDNREHLGMARKFLGKECSDSERKEWSAHNLVSALTPPTFIIAADDDPTISPTNSTLYYQQLKRSHLPAALYIYPSGGHGFGFTSLFPYHEDMKIRLASWIDELQIPGEKAKRVACIGNSITAGAKLRFRNREAWPAQMKEMLGNGYEVKNFGVSGSTMSPGVAEYKKNPEYKAALDFQPNVVVIKLGTNDVQPRYFNGVDVYERAYEEMISQFKALPTNPRIILCLPATSYRTEKVLDMDITEKIIPAIKKIAKHNKLEVIDLHSATTDMEGHFPDKLHPDVFASKVIAERVAEVVAISND